MPKDTNSLTLGIPVRRKLFDMGLSKPLNQRKEAIRLYKSGMSKSAIGRSLGWNRLTVMELIKRYEQDGESGLKARYTNCGKLNRPGEELVYRSVRCFRTWHSGWGAEKIHAELKFLRPELDLPSVRTIHRWMVTNGQVKARMRRQKEKHGWSKIVHGCWQIDAKEGMRTSDGSATCWLNVVDECSGTALLQKVFSPRED